ncbi:His Kinase A (phospho-acceptor) domain-containing protein [Paenibacillus sp. 1_12]|uniref:sensor histidine kinase n=1 Tax=Paenibacillus sp. 1_12 TaxID=1566278 RepID=UPI0008F224A6|nr:HAMP domain-containing sensor histidine kinase [Paenibacillus sp. 1_12]SFL16954.1 His Kinase A (phospho-acceptor) domain-containing protein [Paenibacillus sp. 1_12]
MNQENLFGNEQKILESSRKIMEDAANEDNELLPEFKRLVIDYERLIKLTTKIFKISDIQSKNIKQHEEEMRQLNQDLQHLEKSRRKLMSDISHELGTPMTSVQGYVKAMLDGVIEPGEPHLRMIYNKVLLVNDLVDDLFELSKLEASKAGFHFSEYPLEQLLELLRGRFELEAKDRGFVFSVEDFQEKLPPDRYVSISIDLKRIEQVMNNFVNNAFRYTAPGGIIKIHGEVRMVEQALIDRGGSAGELPCEVTFKVSDSGEGIEEEALPHVFDRFYRAKKAKSSVKSGTGLGLAIAKEIIQQHNGHIGVNSVKNHGCTFYFTLPGAIILEQAWETES